MTLPVIVLRPHPGCGAPVMAPRARGRGAHGEPLLAVRPVAWQAPVAATVDGLLLGSANAMRHAGPALASYSGKPAWCVGETTAEAARAADLAVAGTGSGGLQPLLDTIPPARLLRLCGAERIELIPPPGVSLIERTVYETAPLPISAALAGRLAQGAVILLHSAAAAAHFARETDRLGLDRQRLHLAALGPRIAEAAGNGWASLHTAPQASNAALLALAGKLCQSRA
ncbi:MAG TPA: uroporphyrinogen-III synthase [Novosphingobium sp.]|nr:uroporphyrinogen-III synthase [Novosphingobium sp.]